MDSGACFEGFRRRQSWEWLRGWINPNLTLDIRQQVVDVWLCGLSLLQEKEVQLLWVVGGVVLTMMSAFGSGIFCCSSPGT
jgi:hypothetical protein